MDPRLESPLSWPSLLSSNRSPSPRPSLSLWRCVPGLVLPGNRLLTHVSMESQENLCHPMRRASFIIKTFGSLISPQTSGRNSRFAVTNPLQGLATEWLIIKLGSFSLVDSMTRPERQSTMTISGSLTRCLLRCAFCSCLLSVRRAVDD